MRAFQATCQEPLQGVIPPENTRPVRVCREDDSRCGVLTVRRRRLTTQGGQPLGVIQHPFEWCDGDGAVAPTTGERCFLERPSLHADLFQLCVDTCAPAVPDSLHILLLEHRGAHTAQRLRWPEHVRAVWRPP
jgi:hypothetical protein